MSFEQIVEYVVAGVVAIATSSTTSSIISVIIANRKTRRLDPDAVSKKVIKYIENEPIKIAVTNSIKEFTKDTDNKLNVITGKQEALGKLCIAQSRLISSLAGVYERSDLMTTAQKKILLEGIEDVNKVSEEYFKQTTKPPSDVTIINMQVKKSAEVGSNTETKTKNTINMG